MLRMTMANVFELILCVFAVSKRNFIHSLYSCKIGSHCKWPTNNSLSLIGLGQLLIQSLTLFSYHKFMLTNVRILLLHSRCSLRCPFCLTTRKARWTKRLGSTSSSFEATSLVYHLINSLSREFYTQLLVIFSS
jgi:hypothetical protein